MWSELELATGRRRSKRSAVPGYEPSRYLTWRLHATAADGTAVPVTLACRAGTPLDGSAPCLLYGYGAYESCEFPAFDVACRRCWTAASCTRSRTRAAAASAAGTGGCRAGCAKPNTFDDFVAVAELAGRRRAGLARAGRREPDLGPGTVRRRSAAGRGVLAGPAGGAPSWPRCPSWTASTPCSTPASR